VCEFYFLYGFYGCCEFVFLVRSICGQCLLFWLDILFLFLVWLLDIVLFIFIVLVYSYCGYVNSFV